MWGSFFLKCITIIILFLSNILFGLHCTKSSIKDFIFEDNLENKKGLFNILDPYPALKSYFSSMDPHQFNVKADQSLGYYPEITVDSMRSIANVTLNENIKLKALLMELSNTLLKILNMPSTIRNDLLVYIEKIRNSEFSFIESISIVDNRSLKSIYENNTKQELKNDIDDLIEFLDDPDVETFVQDFDEVIFKSIVLNNNTNNAIKNILFQFVQPDLHGDKQFINDLILILSELGKLSKVKINNKEFHYALKNLIINYESFMTDNNTGETDNQYPINPYYTDTTYNGNPSRLDYILSELFVSLRNLINPSSTYINDTSQNIIIKFLEKLDNIDFVLEHPELIKQSFYKSLILDENGNIRSISNTRPSLLESLLYQITLIDIFGYSWDESCPISDNPPVISGSTNGILTLGDAIFSIRSRNNCVSPLGYISNPDVIRTFQYMNNNAEVWYGTPSNKVIKNSLNHPALCYLQGESKGIVNCIDSNSDGFFDSNLLSANTLLFALDWIVKVTLKGYGPYYVQGESPSPNYQEIWHTEKFKIKLRNGDCAGIDGSQIPSCFGDGTSFTIHEIPKSTLEREVSSKEEAFYKNLQWLLYEKRFILIIPIQIDPLNANLAKDAFFQVIIGNGLKGLMTAKPYCSTPGAPCSKADNGKWLIDGNPIKDYHFAGDLTHWSNEPGDSLVMILGWGCGLCGSFLEAGCTCNWPSTSCVDDNDNGGFMNVFDKTWNVIFPKNENEFFGVNPPVFAMNLEPLERLGFLNNQTVKPSDVDIYWNDRNLLTPIIVALADTLIDLSDTNNNINALKLLTELVQPIIKPMLYKSIDPSTLQGNSAIEILKLRISETCSYDINRCSIRDPALSNPDDYKPISLKTPLAFLIESERGKLDGILIYLTQTDILYKLTKFLYHIKDNPKKNILDQIFTYTKILINEIKLSYELPQPEQFNINYTISKVYKWISEYPDDKNPSNDWDGIKDIQTALNDYLTIESPYSILDNISDFMNFLIIENPSFSEINSIIETLGIIEKDFNNNFNPFMKKIIYEYIINLLKENKEYTKALVGTLTGISEPDTLGDYLIYNAKSKYSSYDILSDLQKFLSSNEIQGTNPISDNFLWNIGQLMNDLADLKESPRKYKISDYYFEDQFNNNQKLSSYDILVKILTK
ncbi:MAG: hypothetical protein KatS3mg129_0852 [Leptospiraceae bacterium]|nr:MAG: hypothetical protein KatS3mg129_0852 [Leptospiraceae bacterium]